MRWFGPTYQGICIPKAALTGGRAHSEGTEAQKGLGLANAASGPFVVLYECALKVTEGY